MPKSTMNKVSRFEMRTGSVCVLAGLGLTGLARSPVVSRRDGSALRQVSKEARAQLTTQPRGQPAEGTRVGTVPLLLQPGAQPLSLQGPDSDGGERQWTHELRKTVSDGAHG